MNEQDIENMSEEEIAYNTVMQIVKGFSPEVIAMLFGGLALQTAEYYIENKSIPKEKSMYVLLGILYHIIKSGEEFAKRQQNSQS
jgi:hypothetical protein